MMTYEEAIEFAQKIVLTSLDLNFSGYMSDDLIDFLSKSVEALEKADKYRWHDLRKNPNDLPSDGQIVIGITLYGKYEFFSYHAYDEWTWELRYNMGTYSKNIIAWKEIEQVKVME